MELTLFSERLRLTPLSMQDSDICHSLFKDPDVVEYAGSSMAEADIAEELKNWTRRGGNGCIGIWCISLLDDGEKIGTVALLPMPIEENETDFSLVVDGDWPDCDIEAGFYLKKTAWGNGYASEACRRILQFAFEQSSLTKVVATFDPENLASRRVLEKSGFVDSGLRRSYGEDGPYFQIARHDWLQRNALKLSR